MASPAPPTDPVPTVAATSRAPRALHRLLTYLALTGIAVAQPVAGVQGASPANFLFAGATATHIVIWALVLVIAPPVLLFAISSVAEFASKRLGWITHVAICAGLFTVFGCHVAARLAVRGPLDLAWGLGIGALGAAALVKWSAVAEVIRFMALVPAVVVVTVLVTGPAAPLVSSSAAPELALESTTGTPGIAVLILDELPMTSLLDASGSIDEVLFPNFARLADSSHTFLNARANADQTIHSLTVAATGTTAGGLESHHRQHETVFTALESSYTTHATEQVTRLCPPRECPDLERERSPLLTVLTDSIFVWARVTGPELVTSRLPPLDNVWGGFAFGLPEPELDHGAGPTVSIDVGPPPGLTPRAPADARLSWVGQIEALGSDIATVMANQGSTAGEFWWRHLPTPHIPWRLLPSGRQYTSTEPNLLAVDGIGANDTWLDAPGLIEQQRQRHLSQLAAIDLELGHLIDAMTDSGAWDETMFIVTADHGATFTAGQPRRAGSAESADDIFRVPMFVHEPGQTAGEIRHDPVGVVDVAPTILAAAGIEPGWETDGSDLLDSASIDREHVLVQPACCALGPEALEFEPTVTNPALSFASVFERGPHQDLIGQTLAEVVALDPRMAEPWIPEQADSLAAVELDTATIPVALSGVLPGAPLDEDQEAVVIVNAMVAGSAVADPTEPGRVIAFVAEHALRDGPNDVRLAWPDELTGQWTLTEKSPWAPSDIARRPAAPWHGSAPTLDVLNAALVDGRWHLSGVSSASDRELADLRVLIDGEWGAVDAHEVITDSSSDQTGPNQTDPDQGSGRPPNPTVADSSFELRIDADLVPDAGTALTLVAETGDLTVTDTVTTQAAPRPS